MADERLHRIGKGRLRLILWSFFVALLVPSGLLIFKAYDELKWESLHHYQQSAASLLDQINTDIKRIIQRESQRSFTDYRFIRNGRQNASPLTDFPPSDAIPGMVGYFQVDDQGHFSTPFAPADKAQAATYGIRGNDWRARLQLRQKMLELLGQAPADKSNAVADAAPAIEGRAMATPPQETAKMEQQLSKQAFSNLVRPKAKAEAEIHSPRAALKVRKKAAPGAMPGIQQAAPITTTAPVEEKLTRLVFDDRPQPLQFSRLNGGYFVLYRKIWEHRQAFVQGLIIQQQDFLNEIIARRFRHHPVAAVSNLEILWHQQRLLWLDTHRADRYLSVNHSSGLSGELLYQDNLSPPLNPLQLRFHIRQLPAPPGASIIHWLATILLLVLVAGFYLLYRMAWRQIELGAQQQDFIAAVSHELKTPITSISMYGEMLQQGWGDERKKKDYYEFIYHESQRLSRLIENVLQLARLSRRQARPQMQDISIGRLMDEVQSAVSAQVQRAGFEWDLDCPEPIARCSVQVDSDYFSQIMINLVDNALKFSAKAEIRRIQIRCHKETPQTIAISIRDYGPGIETAQIKKIFKLFYRPENELTRETTGTGIGLSLVKELAQVMNAQVDVRNVQPGAEFRLILTEK